MFLMPIMLFIIILIIGLIKNNKKMIYWTIGIFYMISTPIFANNFFKIVEGNENRTTIGAIDSADAIVVLSGMLEINIVGDSTYIDWGDPDRYFGGIALLKAGKAKKLVFTGGKLPWDKAIKTEGEVLKEYAASNGAPSDNILVTKDVKNTEDEAVAVKELISPSKKIILVTSAYHMYRAKRLFEQQGFNVIPYKVDYKVSQNNILVVMDFLPDAGSLGQTEAGCREILGRIFYIIRN